jgi:hypothetical protein
METLKIYLYPFWMILREFYDRDFLQKQDEKAASSQSYGRLLSRRLWEEDQIEKPTKSPRMGIRLPPVFFTVPLIIPLFSRRE